MALSHDKCLLASISLDDIVKIIDVSHLGSRIKEEFDEAEYERDLIENPKIKKKKKKSKKSTAVEGGGDTEMIADEEKKAGESSSEDEEDWESDSDDYSDDSDSSDEDMGGPKKTSKKDKKLNIKANNVKVSAKMRDDEKRKQFFSDL